ncbi:MAG TPA: exodeoxyribonuclease VII large subunit, partial [Dehalococcoidia bacterium]|nr:exodeoxyribonuclease VII large subunit [Dehalococcoidia bacterium]
GGSIEDLWPFNEEVVARAIFASRVPVVSAIGHETDYTIADFVADYRAPTPSAAAEAIVPDARSLWQQVVGARHALDLAMDRRLSDHRAGLRQLGRRLRSALPDPAQQRRVLALLGQKLELALANRLIREDQRLETRLAQLEALSPLRTLDRGYAVVTAKGHAGGPLRDPAATRPGEPLTIQLSRGSLTAEVSGS